MISQAINGISLPLWITGTFPRFKSFDASVSSPLADALSHNGASEGGGMVKRVATHPYSRPSIPNLRRNNVCAEVL
jgi:hypothetical protein